MGITKKISLTIWESIKLVWRRLPIIALYSICLAGLWIVGSFAYTQYDMAVVKARPDTDYINYTSLTTNNIREGEDLTYTVCRVFKGRYEVTGERKIYVIPEGKSPRDRVLEVALPYKGSIEKPCESYKITSDVYHLTPGKYQLTLSGKFKVEYQIEKSYSIDGDVLTVYPQPAGAPDVKSQLFNLTPEEIQELKQILGISSDEAQPTAAIRVSPTTQAQPQTSPDPVASPAPSTPTTPAASPAPSPRSCLPLIILSLCTPEVRR